MNRIIPTLFEAIGLFFLTIMTVALGNGSALLQYYGLSSSNQVLHQSVGRTVNTGLSRLDNYSVTASVVTFLVWAVIGAVCFTVAQMLGGVYRELDQERQVSSNRFIHPAQFRRSVFWVQIAGDFLTAVLGLIGLFAGLFLLLVYVFPVALTGTRAYLIGFNYQKLFGFLLGIGVLYGWLLVLTVILKFTLNRHRLRS